MGCVIIRVVSQSAYNDMAIDFLLGASKIICKKSGHVFSCIQNKLIKFYDVCTFIVSSS